MASEDFRRYEASRRNEAKSMQRLAELERGAPLNAGGVGEGGITVRGGTIRILEGGNLEVDGDASFEGDTVVGGALDVTGRTTLGGRTTIGGATDITGDLTVTGAATFGGLTKIGGNAEITGTLKLPAGIIGNDALASPLDFFADDANAEGWAIPMEMTTLARLDITVPQGFTRAVVLGIGTVYGSNATPNLDYMKSRVYVDTPTYSEWGRQLVEPLTPNNGSASLTVTKQSVIPGLSGGQKIAVRVTVHSDFADLPARSTHGATISATVIWAR